MRRWIIAFVVVALLALAYAAWPFVSLVQLGQAVRSGNVDAVLTRVDVASIRQSIAFQLVNEGARGAKIGNKLSPMERELALGFVRSFVDQEFAAVFDADAIRRLLADGDLPAVLAKTVRKQDSAVDETALRLPSLSSRPLADLRRWRFRSPVTFDVRIGQDADPRRWAGLRLRRTGLTWVLTEIRLPPAVVEQLKRIVQQRLKDAIPKPGG